MRSCNTQTFSYVSVIALPPLSTKYDQTDIPPQSKKKEKKRFNRFCSLYCFHINFNFALLEFWKWVNWGRTWRAVWAKIDAVISWRLVAKRFGWVALWGSARPQIEAIGWSREDRWSGEDRMGRCDGKEESEEEGEERIRRREWGGKVWAHDKMSNVKNWG